MRALMMMTKMRNQNMGKLNKKWSQSAKELSHVKFQSWPTSRPMSISKSSSLSTSIFFPKKKEESVPCWKIYKKEEIISGKSITWRLKARRSWRILNLMKIIKLAISQKLISLNLTNLWQKCWRKFKKKTMFGKKNSRN